MGPLEFLDPDLGTFRCLALALEAGRTGGTLPCVMNAANEVAVAAFLADACRLTDIDATVERVLEQMGSEPVESLEQLEDIDARSRAPVSYTHLDVYKRQESLVRRKNRVHHARLRAFCARSKLTLAIGSR